MSGFRSTETVSTRNNPIGNCGAVLRCYAPRGMIEVSWRALFLAAAFALMGPAALAAPPPSMPARDAPAIRAPITKPVSVEALFREFGLFGTWAVDCGAPSSPTNPFVEVVAPGAGAVAEIHDVGPGNVRNRYDVLSAERLAADRIGLRVVFLPGTDFEERQRLEVVVRGDTRRTMFNQPDGEPPRVKDGVVVGFGLKTPLLKKCG